MQMPRPPAFSAVVGEMPGAVYSPFADRLHDHPGPLYALHVGDTHLEPFVGARMQDQLCEAHPGLHQYCDTRGLPVLVDAIVEKVRSRNGLACERESVLVSAGATAGLGCAAGAVVAPGEEVLILAPFWPLIRGIVQSVGGTPVEVPFYDRITSAADAVAAIRERLSERSVALYVSTPSNPTGRVLPRSWLEAIAELAEAHDLWLFSDEVYEDFVYRGEHVSLGSLAPGRTVSFYSFSKAYGMAGNRVGYLVGPPALIDEARKLGTHSYYNAPTAAQHAARVALEEGAGWQAQARDEYRRTAEQAARALDLPVPEGSTFLFIDAADRLGERGMPGLLEDCFAAGVLVAPGGSSGCDYESWLRLCYTVLPPEETAEAIRRLAGPLGRSGPAQA
jgi:N-succinyldiaminopimelate aminotransferase